MLQEGVNSSFWYSVVVIVGGGWCSQFHVPKSPVQPLDITTPFTEFESIISDFSSRCDLCYTTKNESPNQLELAITS